MGPLAGVRVIELDSLGAGPFCGMMLADMGAQVLSIVRPGALSAEAPPQRDPLRRSRQRLTLDLHSAAGREALLALLQHADVFFEGFRPGVVERLGVGPDACLALNPALVYGRLTGWGQQGPLAGAAGHDINYLALSGALHPIGPSGGKPVPPLNLVADFGGGGMMLAFGLVCALLEARRSGRGQVVDAAMVDGCVALMGMALGMRGSGLFNDAVGSSVLAGAAHYYDTYATADGKFIAIGALEPAFYAELLQRLGLARSELANAGLFGPNGRDPQVWRVMKPRLEALFLTRTQAQWCELLEGTDACFAPVLTLAEAASHPHLRARGSFIEVAGQLQNAPAPRFSRSQADAPQPPKEGVQELQALLAGWGCDQALQQQVMAASGSAQQD